MKERDSFMHVSHAFSSVLMGAVVFGVKGAIVLLYSTSTVPHVSTNEVVVMWSLLLGGALYFVATVGLLAMNAADYRLSESLNAYKAFVFAMLLYSGVTTLECSRRGSVLCRYLFPLSTDAT
eukprot:3263128-Rhodomonas_salina.1